MKMLKTELRTVFNDQELVDKIAGEMQRTVLMDSESIICRVISGLTANPRDLATMTMYWYIKYWFVKI